MRRSPLRRKKPLARRNDERLAARRALAFGEQAELCRQMPCCACGAPPPSDPAHVPSRGAGGRDEDTVPLCRDCHGEQHMRGEWTFQRVELVSFADVKRVMRLPVDELKDALASLEEGLGKHQAGCPVPKDPEAECQGNGCEEAAETDAKTIDVVLARIELARTRRAKR